MRVPSLVLILGLAVTGCSKPAPLESGIDLKGMNPQVRPGEF